MIERTHTGGYFRKRTEAKEILKRIISDLAERKIDLVISSANGTFIDQAECRALQHLIPDTIVYTVKPALGESVGAAGLWQVILGAQALDRGELPPMLHVASTIPLRVPAARTVLTRARHAIVLSCGVNQQVAGLRLSIP
jgi:3-oxoacyl-(acyl-carrier-protein) synthase